MIIFYNKKTGEIKGTIEGRVHPKEHLEMWIGDKEKIERYIVPFEPNIIDGETRGLKPAVPFADLIYDFEAGKKSIYDYKLSLDKKGQVKGFEKKVAR